MGLGENKAFISGHVDEVKYWFTDSKDHNWQNRLFCLSKMTYAEGTVIAWNTYVLHTQCVHMCTFFSPQPCKRFDRTCTKVVWNMTLNPVSYELWTVTIEYSGWIKYKVPSPAEN
jgi:hypothetical protein